LDFDLLYPQGIFNIGKKVLKVLLFYSFFYSCHYHDFLYLAKVLTVNKVESWKRGQIQQKDVSV